MPKFQNTAFPMSTDYDLLWTLVMLNGQRIPAWLLNLRISDIENNELYWDLVEVKQIYDEYHIGTRGRSYEAEQNKEGFIKCCTMWHLHFILPQNI